MEGGDRNAQQAILGVVCGGSERLTAVRSSIMLVAFAVAMRLPAP